MFVSLVTFLARTKQEFLAVGVDVKIQEQVQIQIANLDLTKEQQVFLIEGNSLEALPNFVEQNAKFDVVLIDGDHNYHTVSNELKFLEAITHQHSIVLIDDYLGRWSDKDLWYAEREGYEENKTVSARVETEKHGVKPAVDEWLAEHTDWHSSTPVSGEPIVLARKTPQEIEMTNEQPRT